MFAEHAVQRTKQDELDDGQHAGHQTASANYAFQYARGSYTTMASLPLFIVALQSELSPSPPVVEPPGARIRRARLQRDGIGAKGTFNPPPLTVNPCAQVTPPLIVTAWLPLCKLLMSACRGRRRFVDRVEQLAALGMGLVTTEPKPSEVRVGARDRLFFKYLFVAADVAAVAGVVLVVAVVAVVVGDPLATQRLPLLCRLAT